MLRIIAGLIAAVFALGTLAAPVYAAGKEAPKTETKQPAKPAAPKKEPLDINSASETDLKALPGIGDAYAKKIDVWGATPTARARSKVDWGAYLNNRFLIGTLFNVLCGVVGAAIGWFVLRPLKQGVAL